MRVRRYRLLPVLLLASACGGPPPAPAPGPVRTVAPGLEVQALAPGVWLHTTWRDLEGYGRLPSNGLVVEDGDGLLLVDSAWGDEETRTLVAWLEAELGRPVTRMIATHHHDDRLSGSGWLKARGTRVVAHPLTPALAVANGVEPPEPLPGLEAPGSAVRVGPVEVFYPGAGHAVDNVVVWLPEHRILLGGCAVRPDDTRSLGNVADADLESWPRAVARVRARYGDARLVVPGHDAPGGVGHLDHTLSLFEGSPPAPQGP